MRKTLTLLFILNCVLFSLNSFFFLKMTSGSEQVFTFEQPKERGAVTVNVLKDGKRFYLFELEDRYVLHVGHLNRGIFLDITLFNEREDVVIYLKKCHIQRTLDGISFVQPNGYITFIPRSEYD